MIRIVLILFIFASNTALSQSYNISKILDSLINSVNKEVLNIDSAFSENIFVIGIPDSIQKIYKIHTTIPVFKSYMNKLTINDSSKNYYYYLSNCHSDNGHILNSFVELTRKGLDSIPNLVSIKLDYSSGFFTREFKDAIVYDTNPENINIILNIYFTDKKKSGEYVISKSTYLFSLNSNFVLLKSFMIEKRKMIISKE